VVIDLVLLQLVYIRFWLVLPINVGWHFESCYILLFCVNFLFLIPQIPTSFNILREKRVS
jgi:hypothetical protein